MNRHHFEIVRFSILWCCALSVFVASPALADTIEEARGIVFIDRNESGQFDEGDEPLPGIRVSNGRDIVLTDEDGQYELEISGDATIFLIKPQGYRTPVNEYNLPQFFYLHRPEGSPEMRFAGIAPTGPLPESIDFPLIPQEEPDRFKMIIFADTQPRHERDVYYFARDVIDELAGSETAREAAFGITLGDIVHDDLSLFEKINAVISAVGIPWYNVPGNHDNNLDAPSDFYTLESFQRVYGPRHYSFDYGPVHFMVLDNTRRFDEDGTKKYFRGLGATQREFVVNNLELVPRDRRVVILLHQHQIGRAEIEELFSLLEDRPYTLSLAGHAHTHRHHLFQQDGWPPESREPHHHIVHGVAGGAPRIGAQDEYGIPHGMQNCGTPTGYSILTFDGTDYQHRFKAARRPADFQMNIHLPDEASPGDMVRATIFNAMPNADVSMKIAPATEWISMTRRTQQDPYFQAMAAREGVWSTTPYRRSYSSRTSQKTWERALPEEMKQGPHVIRVRAENPDGQIFEGARVLVIEE